MRASGFYEGVAHLPFHWQDRTFYSPTFYYDVRMLSAQFMAPLKMIRALLPSEQLHPLRVTPGHGVVAIVAYEYRASDLGPYNETAIAIPVSLGRPSPVFTGLLRKAPEEPDAFLVHLPVTTEIAYRIGVETAAYPKFLAEIEFEDEGDWVGSRLSEAGQHILTLRVRKGPLRPTPRSRLHPINTRAGRLLRSMVISDEREEFVSRKASDARLELGDHRMAQELRNLRLGQMLECAYAPRMQTILMPVMESFEA